MKLKTITREIDFSKDTWKKMADRMFVRYLESMTLDEINNEYDVKCSTLQEAFLVAIENEKSPYDKAYMYAETDIEALIVKLCSINEALVIEKGARRIFDDLPSGKVRDFILLPADEDIVVIPDGFTWPSLQHVKDSGTYVPDSDPNQWEYVQQVYTPREIRKYSIEGLLAKRKIFDPTTRYRVKYPNKGEYTITYHGNTMSLLDDLGAVVFFEKKTRKEFSAYIRALKKAGQLI